VLGEKVPTSAAVTSSAPSITAAALMRGQYFCEADSPTPSVIPVPRLIR